MYMFFYSMWTASNIDIIIYKPQTIKLIDQQNATCLAMVGMYLSYMHMYIYNLGTCICW